jgi:hypothetical protein
MELLLFFKNNLVEITMIKACAFTKIIREIEKNKRKYTKAAISIERENLI